ncbi:hypothetical protein Tco_1271576 [Tanacetum coccineum]
MGCVSVRVESIPSNPSPSLALNTISPLKGCFGLSDLPGWRVIGAMGRWEVVGVSWESTWEVVLQVKTVGRGWYGMAGRVVRVRLWLAGLKGKYGEEAKCPP